MKPFRTILILLSSAVLLSCKSTSSLLLHPAVAEMNRRAPGIFNVRMETTKGEIDIEVHRNWSPHGADRFYNLVRGGYYDDSYFYRVMPHWAQFGINGDPKISTAWREQTIPDDPRIVSNTRGTIAFAFAVPNGRTTQVFINLTENATTHDAEFAPFGKIIKGMKVAEALNGEYQANQPAGAFEVESKGRFLKRVRRICSKNFPHLDRIIHARVSRSSREVGLDERR